ncbi:hypothetical protein A3Q56_06240 [Intoshia linei]|uniref:Uncharacterized protein n=1 Tax=Intoshia linei TaxID=1819745 RepID=A0A177AXE7_9BILA|nr:hypothetical protein A3Q56_06240 [Intoshia linei]
MDLHFVEYNVNSNVYTNILCKSYIPFHQIRYILMQDNARPRVYTKTFDFLKKNSISIQICENCGLTRKKNIFTNNKKLKKQPIKKIRSNQPTIRCANKNTRKISKYLNNRTKVNKSLFRQESLRDFFDI